MSETQRCKRCRVNLPLTKFVKKRCGNYMVQCIDCNTKQNGLRPKCSHGARKDSCRTCSNRFCKHGREAFRCIECGGSGLCKKHKIRIDRCRECGGTAFCKHDRRFTDCAKCGGSQICEHDIFKKSCRKCDLESYLYNNSKTRISMAFKGVLGKKYSELLGCDKYEFKKYIDNQLINHNEYFGTEFNYENYGLVWELDHIIPFTYGNPSIEEKLSRCDHTNIQVLGIAANQLKGDRYTWNQEEAYLAEIFGVNI